MPINYLFSFPLSISYFLLGLEYQLFRKDSWLVWMGANASMYIYYWHNLILQTEKSLLSSKVRIIYENPFLLFGQALILSCLIVFVKNNWKIGKKPDVIHD